MIRPDLLLTEDGFALTEIDSVPGGIGLTAFLNRLYAGVSESIIGDNDAMLDGFYRALAAKAPDKHAPMIVIVVSDEAAEVGQQGKGVDTETRQRFYEDTVDARDERDGPAGNSGDDFRQPHGHPAP